MKSNQPIGYEVLHIQSGLTRRSALSKEDWKKIWSLLHEMWAEKLITNQWDPSIKVVWSTWYKKRGLIACQNEATVNFVRNIIADIKLDGKCFRAWKKGEFGFPTLVTIFLPEGTNGK